MIRGPCTKVTAPTGQNTYFKNETADDTEARTGKQTGLTDHANLFAAAPGII